MPELYIITGSNGAGKSSIGPNYLPSHIRQKGPVFDGDKLFVEKRKELWRTIKSNKKCSKLAYAFVSETFDQLVETALSGMLDIAYEGHFTNEATWDIPRRFRTSGAVIENGEPSIFISSTTLPGWFTTQLPGITQKIKASERKIT